MSGGAASVARLVLPLLAVGMAAQSCRQQPQPPRNRLCGSHSALGAAVFLLVLGLAWSQADRGALSSNLCYVVLVALLSGLALSSCSADAAPWKTVTITAPAVTVTFLIYTLAKAQSAEQILLVPLFCSLLLDLVATMLDIPPE